MIDHTLMDLSSNGSFVNGNLVIDKNGVKILDEDSLTNSI